MENTQCTQCPVYIFINKIDKLLVELEYPSGQYRKCKTWSDLPKTEEEEEEEEEGKQKDPRQTIAELMKNFTEEIITKLKIRLPEQHEKNMKSNKSNTYMFFNLSKSL